MHYCGENCRGFCQRISFFFLFLLGHNEYLQAYVVYFRCILKGVSFIVFGIKSSRID